MNHDAVKSALWDAARAACFAGEAGFQCDCQNPNQCRSGVAYIHSTAAAIATFLREWSATEDEFNWVDCVDYSPRKFAPELAAAVKHTAKAAFDV
jgi:hypothetical protein